MNSALMFSKASDEWSTPQDCFDALDSTFRFVFDAAATKENRKKPAYMGPDHQVAYLRDALSVDWAELAAGVDGGPVRPVFWLNPPYSKCRAFIAKAAIEAQKGCTVVCLVPSRTDTRWWHEHVWDRESHVPWPGVEIRFIKGRLKFGGCDNAAPFPSVVIVFRPVV